MSHLVTGTFLSGNIRAILYTAIQYSLLPNDFLFPELFFYYSGYIIVTNVKLLQIQISRITLLQNIFLVF